MDFDFCWLFIISVVFGLGWSAARYDLKHFLSKSARRSRSYLQGLNFLLNEETDQAINILIEVARLDPETTELYFALGNLFRRRGEMERAIRVHQNLLARENLRANEQNHALYELGQDFLKAGLLDRAEEIFRQLHGSDYALRALQALLTIFKIEKEWHKAIIAAKKIEEIGALSLGKEISQFHCELAQEALRHKRIDDAREALQQALQSNPKNVRATLLSGDIELACNEPMQAISHWRQVEQKNPACLPLVAHKLMQAYITTGQSQQGASLLAYYVKTYYSNDLLDVAYKHIAELHGVDAAHALARMQMLKLPNLISMKRLLETHIIVAEEPRRGELVLMRTLICQHAKNLPRYICRNCGFRARLFYWQCPGCSGWETYVPQQPEPVTVIR
ncbi:lipopolysaccharide assembly protein LapB [Candidatus Vallotiella sp. (ex Adelges kitamiensis)]|uniref:lipopolysaccharide assembly protein LapB n=1 Tax=Candidatus Vallotiella sp. (ex Adelges kitamiensis) TaxID=2864217 RepID=UPI001CE3438C|nr:lipopolysaccharide assembly protein LapB [Candidatus Vallotia sp. (ex Adelges kitamiensis)]